MAPLKQKATGSTATSGIMQSTSNVLPSSPVKSTSSDELSSELAKSVRGPSSGIKIKFNIKKSPTPNAENRTPETTTTSLDNDSADMTSTPSPLATPLLSAGNPSTIEGDSEKLNTLSRLVRSREQGNMGKYSTNNTAKGNGPPNKRVLKMMNEVIPEQTFKDNSPSINGLSAKESASKNAFLSHERILLSSSPSDPVNFVKIMKLSTIISSTTKTSERKATTTSDLSSSPSTDNAQKLPLPNTQHATISSLVSSSPESETNSSPASGPRGIRARRTTKTRKLLARTESSLDTTIPNTVSGQKKRRCNNDSEFKTQAKRVKQIAIKSTTKNATESDQTESKNTISDSSNADQKPPIIGRPLSREPALCCASLTACDPNAMFTCDNATCLNRQMIKIFVGNMKVFPWNGSIRRDPHPEFMISVLRLEQGVKQPMTASRIKEVTTEWVETGPARFFVKAADEEVAVFAEIRKNDQSVKGLNLMAKSEMEFNCVAHSDVRFTLSYWGLAQRNGR